MYVLIFNHSEWGISFITLFRSVTESVTATLCNILTGNNLPTDCVIVERSVPVKMRLAAEIFSRAIFTFALKRRHAAEQRQGVTFQHLSPSVYNCSLLVQLADIPLLTVTSNSSSAGTILPQCAVFVICMPLRPVLATVGAGNNNEGFSSAALYWFEINSETAWPLGYKPDHYFVHEDR
jgi:hypothetical protein